MFDQGAEKGYQYSQSDRADIVALEMERATPHSLNGAWQEQSRSLKVRDAPAKSRIPSIPEFRRRTTQQSSAQNLVQQRLLQAKVLLIRIIDGLYTLFVFSADTYRESKPRSPTRRVGSAASASSCVHAGCDPSTPAINPILMA
jgi:hypothetical protein